MRLSVGIVITAALIAAVAVIVGGNLLVNPNRPLVSAAGFQSAVLTPNADGSDDVVVFVLDISRPAHISITLTSAEGESFAFRQNQRTPAGDFAMQFGGVVEGYLRPGETVEGEVLRRLIPEGDYTWTLDAVDVESGVSEQATGSLKVSDASADLPILQSFSISPTIFTPNQDGVADRVAISAFLTKDADVTAYLIGAEGERYYIAPRQNDTEFGKVGWQQFDFEGGVDIGADPPDDGEYTVVVEVQDAVGQKTAQRGQLEIRDGGKPRAGIVAQPTGADVVFVAAPYDERFASDSGALGDFVAMPDDPQAVGAGQVVIPIGDLLVFSLVVENYGKSPIRTDGPPPGTVYQQRQVAAALNAIEQDGVWRVGIQCETSEESYPYRWAVGRTEDLRVVEDPTNDNTYMYLAPGARSIVWGAVRMTDIVSTSNPQQCWAGLIHEGVSVENNRIGARDILIADTRSE